MPRRWRNKRDSCSGQDKLKVGYIVDEGRTTALGDSRTVDLATLGQKGNIASQLAAGIVMGHEAYRNGIDDGALMQEYETQRAVLGHTEMALRVAKEYGMGFITQNAKLSRDVAEYLKGLSPLQSTWEMPMTAALTTGS